MTVPFTPPFRPVLGEDYIVAIDYVTYYPKTEHYPWYGSHGSKPA